MYDLDKFNLDEKEWRKRLLESELKNINKIKILNNMIHMNDNKVNNMGELITY